MAVQTRVIIDANASNAIREIGKLDDAAADADKTIGKLDGASIDVDTGGAVSELDAIDRAAADAKGELDKLDAQKVAVKVDIDVDTDRLDTVRNKLDDVDKSGRAGSTAIGGVGNSISELPGIGALGPIAESLGQLTENALEGGESIGGIGKAIGVLGGTAAVMYGISRAMQSLADTKAFNAKQVETFRDALEDTGDAASAVLAVIKEAGGIKGRSGGLFGFFEGTKDVTAELRAAGVAGKEFLAAVTPGPGAAAALQAVTDKLRDQRDALLQSGETYSAEELDARRAQQIEYNNAIEVVTEALKLNTEAAEENAGWADFLSEGIGKASGEFLKLDGSADAATTSLGFFETGLADATTEALALRDANKRLRNELSNRGAYLDLLDTFDALKVTGEEAWYAAASGAEDAESKARDYEQAQIDAKLELESFLDTMDVPFDKRVDIQTLIDQGEYLQAAAAIQELTKEQTVDVKFRLWNPGGIRISQGGGGGIPIGLAAPSSSLTVNVNARPSMLEVDNAINRWSRLNGSGRR